MLILEIAAGVVLGGLILSVLQSSEGQEELWSLIKFLTVVGAIIGGCFLLVVLWSSKAGRGVFGVVGVFVFLVTPPLLLHRVLHKKFPNIIKAAAKPYWEEGWKRTVESAAIRLGIYALYLSAVVVGYIVGLWIFGDFVRNNRA